jgi:hypothetical protein
MTTGQVLLTREEFSTWPSKGSGMGMRCGRSLSNISAALNWSCSGWRGQSA